MQRSWTRVIYFNPVCLFEIEIVALLFSGCWIFSFSQAVTCRRCLLHQWLNSTWFQSCVWVWSCVELLCVSYEVVTWAPVHLKVLWTPVVSVLSAARPDSEPLCKTWCFWFISLWIKKKWVDCFSLGLFFSPLPPSIDHLISDRVQALSHPCKNQFDQLTLDSI